MTTKEKLPWEDKDFKNPVHTTVEGVKLNGYICGVVAEIKSGSNLTSSGSYRWCYYVLKDEKNLDKFIAMSRQGAYIGIHERDTYCVVDVNHKLFSYGHYKHSRMLEFKRVNR